MTAELQRFAMRVFYAAGLLALVSGGLDLWRSVDSGSDSPPGRQLGLSAVVLLSCAAYRWGLATGDPTILYGRTGGIAGLGIATGFLALMVFALWQTVR